MRKLLKLYKCMWCGYMTHSPNIMNLHFRVKKHNKEDGIIYTNTYTMPREKILVETWH